MINTKNDEELWDNILVLEIDKLIHFIVAYTQKNILIFNLSGRKNDKHILGYNFDEINNINNKFPIYNENPIILNTKLYHKHKPNDIQTVSYYIKNAYNGIVNNEIAIQFKKNIYYLDLIDMINYDSLEFDNTISLIDIKDINKSSEIEDSITITKNIYIYEAIKLGDLVKIVQGLSPKPIKNYLTNNINDMNWIKIGNIDYFS